jgi:hypothetical protein
MVLLAVKNEIKANDDTKTARFMYRASNGNAFPTVSKLEIANLATIYHGFLKLVFFTLNKDWNVLEQQSTPIFQMTNMHGTKLQLILLILYRT